MKQNSGDKKKFNIGFVIAALVVVALAVVLSIKTGGDVVPPDVKPLPIDEENNIHELVISEIMSNNKGAYVSQDNKIVDYLEIYNGTSKAINLNGYGLSDREDRVKWIFSDVYIRSGEYLVVALTGELEPGLNADFKLSSKGGEKVILTNANSKIIDAVETVALNKNNAMMRDKDGQWFVSQYGTPGFSNNEAGLEQYFQSLKGEQQGELSINEFLCRNKGNFISPAGSFDGFLELINISDHVVNLGEYTLGDNKATPFMYSFEDRLLNPGELYVVYTGYSYTEADYIGFSFEKSNGVIVLGKNGKIVEDIEYENLASGQAYIRDANGNYYNSGVVSPGYPNTPEGIAAFQKASMTTPKDLIINEVMPSNDKYMAHNGGQYYDWIELKNNSGATIKLSDYSIGKSENNLGNYQLPEVELEPGAYFILMCSGNTSLSTKTYYHADFKIGASDGLFLFKGSTLADCVYVSGVPYGYSYGRLAEGWGYLSKPTAKEDNGDGKRTIAETVKFSQSAGVYNDVKNVKVELIGEGTIYYTTDGSIPTTDSKKYTGPITLTKTTVVKARAVVSGAITSTLACASYIINENHTVPVMSVSLKPSDFTYLNQHSGTVGIERVAYAEFFEDGGSFSIPCSLACFGGNTRFHAKKSYALRFKNEYGASKLVYPVFENRDNSVYDSLVLRTGSNDWNVAYMRDILTTSLIDEYTDVDVQAYKICVVYINGNYWGLYNLREKINAAYFNEKYNISKESVNIARIDGNVTAGSKKGYNDLRSYVNTNGATSANAYKYIGEHLNLAEFCDYWIAEAYTTNNDILNCRFWNSKEYDGGRWHYIAYDFDYAWYNVNINYYTRYLTRSTGIGDGYDYENVLSRNLFKNSDFRKLWLERLSYNVANTWNTKNVLNRIDEIQKVLEPEMARNCSRWNLSKSKWESNVNDLRTYAKKRMGIMLNQTKSFFGLSNTQMKNYFGSEWK